MSQLILEVCSVLVRIIDFLVLVRCLLSWFPVDRDGPIVRLIYILTEPLLAPIRKMIFNSPLGGQGMMIDFSPIFVFILCEFALSLLQSFLR